MFARHHNAYRAWVIKKNSKFFDMKKKIYISLFFRRQRSFAVVYLMMPTLRISNEKMSADEIVPNPSSLNFKIAGKLILLYRLFLGQINIEILNYY